MTHPVRIVIDRVVIDERLAGTQPVEALLAAELRTALGGQVPGAGRVAADAAQAISAAIPGQGGPYAHA